MFTGHIDHHRRDLARGFTLIEVMIVVAIVAILASVALPAYTSYIRRGQMQEAFTNLANYRVLLEQYYQDNRMYSNTATSASCGTATTTALTAADVGGDAKYFDYSCTITTGTNGQNYTVTATGKTGTNVAGYAYSLTDSGAKATTQFAGSSATTSCWATKSASDCS